MFTLICGGVTADFFHTPVSPLLMTLFESLRNHYSLVTLIKSSWSISVISLTASRTCSPHQGMCVIFFENHQVHSKDFVSFTTSSFSILLTIDSAPLHLHSSYRVSLYLNPSSISASPNYSIFSFLTNDHIFMDFPFTPCRLLIISLLYLNHMYLSFIVFQITWLRYRTEI